MGYSRGARAAKLERRRKRQPDARETKWLAECFRHGFCRWERSKIQRKVYETLILGMKSVRRFHALIMSEAGRIDVSRPKGVLAHHESGTACDE
jgi:hypothetical protein